MNTTGMERRVATILYDARWINLVLLIVGTAVAAVQFKHFAVDHNLMGQVDPRSEEVVHIRDLEATFGRSDAVVVAVKAANIFDPVVLGELKRLSGVFEQLPNVDSVLSLANATVLADVDGSPQAVRVLDAFEKGKQTPAELRARVLTNPRLMKLVISPDGTAAAINLLISAKMRSAKERDALMDAIQAELRQIRVPGVKGYYTGNTPLIVDAIRSMGRDMKRYIWMTPLVMAVLLIGLFHRANAVGISLALILVTVVWTLGLFFGLRNILGLASSILPVLIALITLTDVIHCLALYYATGDPGRSNRERIIETMEHLLLACLMTAVTTAIGLVTSITSEVETIRQFGLWSGIGVMLSYGLVMVGLPVLLSLFPGRPPSERLRKAAFWTRIYSFSRSGRIGIWAGAVLVLVASGWAMRSIQVEAQVADLLPKDTPAMQGLRLVNDELLGIGNLEVVIKGAPGVFEEPWALAEVQEIHEFVERIPGMNVVISPWSVLRDLHAVLGEDVSSPHGIPAARVDVHEYYMMLEASAAAKQVSEYVVRDRSRVRVSGHCRGLSSSEYLRDFQQIEEFARAHLDPRLKLHTTGRMKVFSKTVVLLVESQLSSIFWSVLMIAGVLVWHFRSFKAGLVSLLPNLFPVIVPLGLMGLLKIPLTATTVIVSNVAMGMAVDNSIHFLARYRMETRKGRTMEEALRRTVVLSGRAIVISSLVIAGGFTIFLFSEFAANRYFGLLMAASMLVAPVVDLLLLPVLIRLTNVR